MDYLQVGQVMPTAVGPVGRASRLDGVKGLSYGSIPEGMEVDLEAESIEFGDVRPGRSDGLG